MLVPIKFNRRVAQGGGYLIIPALVLLAPAPERYHRNIAADYSGQCAD